MPQIQIVPPRPAPTHNRRAADRAPENLPTDLAPGEFHLPSMTPGAHFVSFSQSGHEHKVDPERLTVTCEVCKSALEAVNRGECARELTIEVSPETYVALDGEGGRVGMRPAEFAAKLLEEWRPAR